MLGVSIITPQRHCMLSHNSCCTGNIRVYLVIILQIVTVRQFIFFRDAQELSFVSINSDALKQMPHIMFKPKNLVHLF